MSAYDHWYSHDTPPCVEVNTQVFAVELVQAIKELTSEIKELRKMMEERKLK